LVREWESVDESQSRILAEAYLQLRHGVWHFRENAVPLCMVFNELTGGLLTSFTSRSPVQEQEQFHCELARITGTVWVALNLNEVCPSPPPFPMMNPSDSSIRDWQGSKQSMGR
jgi:hypothetical protein